MLAWKVSITQVLTSTNFWMHQIIWWSTITLKAVTRLVLILSRGKNSFFASVLVMWNGFTFERLTIADFTCRQINFVSFLIVCVLFVNSFSAPCQWQKSVFMSKQSKRKQGKCCLFFQSIIVWFCLQLTYGRGI